MVQPTMIEMMLIGGNVNVLKRKQIVIRRKETDRLIKDSVECLTSSLKLSVGKHQVKQIDAIMLHYGKWRSELFFSCQTSPELTRRLWGKRLVQTEPAVD